MGRHFKSNGHSTEGQFIYLFTSSATIHNFFIVFFSSHFYAILKGAGYLDFFSGDDATLLLPNSLKHSLNN